MKHLLHKHWPTLFWAVVVFVLAVMIRLPNLYESFWVDELHTAWCIWGDLDEVALRAAIGNQTPLYFQLMWFWKAIVGESELALRMSSVLAVAFASVLLVVGVQQTSKSLAAGVLAGLILAIETNSLYFGTEFRPYAFVMLLSVIATWAAVSLLDDESKVTSGNLRLIFVAAVGLATLLHPTALVTFGVLAVVVLSATWLQHGLNFRFQISDFVSFILIAAVVFTLINSSLLNSWEHRSRWAAFGKVTKWSELWIKWPWLPLVIFPTLIRLLGKTPRTRTNIIRAYAPMIAGALATILFFVASYIDWVPLWHRRYFIAVLPMLAWSAGACAMLFLPVNPSSTAKRFAWGVVVVVAGMLFWQQGSWRQFRATQTWGEPRGEDWRRAVAWVNEERVEGEKVEINAGLIEAAGGVNLDDFSFKAVAFLDEYLCCPISGPYGVEDVDHIAISARIRMYIGMHLAARSGSESQTHWVVSRSPRATVESWVHGNLAVPIESRSFGNIDVIHYKWLSEQQYWDRLRDSEPNGDSGVE